MIKSYTEVSWFLILLYAIFIVFGLLFSGVCFLVGLKFLGWSSLILSCFSVFLVRQNFFILLPVALIVNLLFAIFYTPVFGLALSYQDFVVQDNLRQAIGIRPAFSSLVVLYAFLIFYITRPDSRIAILLLLSLFCFWFVFSGSPLLQRLAYLLNSFFPFYSLLIFFWFYKKGVFSNIPLLNSGDKCFVLLFWTLLFFGAVVHAIYYLDYSIFRPDLVTSIRTRDAMPVEYGSYPAYWSSVLFGFRVTRFAGSLPDAIVFGYLMSFFSLFFLYKSRFILFWISLSFILITLSKGALLFFVQAIVLFFVISFSRALFYFTCLFFVALQIFLSGVLDTSASVHLEGLLGGLRSFISGGPYNFLFGAGLGEGGNLKRLADFGVESRVLWLASGSESGIGVTAYQLGFIGLAFALYLLFSGRSSLVVISESSKRKDNFIYALIFSLFINSFLQETVLNASVSGVLFLFVFLVVSQQENKKSLGSVSDGVAKRC